MTRIFYFIALLFTSQFAMAQAYDGQADYNRKTQPAVLANYSYTDEIVTKSLKDNLTKLGLRTKNSRGYIVVENAVISSISSSSLDYAFKVDRKSRRDNDQSIISLVITLNNENVTALNNTSAKSFLDNLLPTIVAVNTDDVINNQFIEVTKAQKKLKNLQDDQSSMERRIKNLEEDIAKNKRDQENQQKEIQKQQELLETLKLKKTSL